jgi:HAD superfamily hydrolase (TIGR01450 family)
MSPGGPTPSPATDPAAAFASARLWIIDLDGVVWLTGRPIGDPGGAIAALRDHGVRVVFATNNSAPTTAELLARLDNCGVSAPATDLVTSAGALASLLQPGESVRALAEGGVLEALDARGVTVVDGDHDESAADAAVVGWSRSFDFNSLAATASVARATGRLLATNEDPTHPTPTGLVPGAGSLLAAVATASGVTPVIAGKPHQPMATLMQDAFGFKEGDGSAVVIGDQPRTDGRLAERLKAPFGLVDSGVTPAGAERFEVPVDLRSLDFATLVRTVLG